jgi:hypothetical protein
MNRRRDIATHCASCGADGWRSAFLWLAHEDFCPTCMTAMVDGGLCTQTSGALHALTPAGELALPQHRTVADCAWCGTAVYQRWLDDGQATLKPHPTCLFCMGTTPSPTG